MSYEPTIHCTRISVSEIASLRSFIPRLVLRSGLTIEAPEGETRNAREGFVRNQAISGLVWAGLRQLCDTSLALDCDYMEDIRLLEYRKGEGYSWHDDNGSPSTSHRMLTLVIQLSDTGDYSGGDLEISCQPLEVVTAPRERGTLIVFPSNLAHRITPIETGIRQSLCTFVGSTPVMLQGVRRRL